jgi:Peptidase A4 family
MRISRVLTFGTALCAVALFAAQPASAAASTAVPAPSAIAHASTGCGGAVVHTPQPGTALTAQSLGLPAIAGSFYAEAASHHVTWLSSLTCTSRPITHPLTPAAATPRAASTTSQAASTGRSNTIDSSNWSGYQINQTVQYVQSGWTVPTVTRPVPAYSSSGAYYSSIWAGIGGGFNAGSGALIQAGTSQDILSNGATSDYAWYEIVGGTGDTGSEREISLPIHPGDVVGDGSLWTPTGGAEMGVCNFTSGTCVNFTLASSAPGTSAEWIVEAPYNGGILPLADYGTATFVNGCWAPSYYANAPCYTLTAGAPTAIALESYVLGAYHILSSPGPMNSSGGGFTTTYYLP